MNTYIDKVIVINLIERQDRKVKSKKILEEIFDVDKIIYFKAIKDINGNIGCAKSHIECLNLVIKNNKWNNVLIVEDDIVWTKSIEGEQIFKNLITKKFDVIILGGAWVFYNPFSYNVYKSVSNTAYIVHRSYLTKLKQLWEYGLQQQILTANEIYAVDIYWDILKLRDNWKIVYPALFIQETGISNTQESIRKIPYAMFHYNNLKLCIYWYRDKIACLFILSLISYLFNIITIYNIFILICIFIFYFLVKVFKHIMFYFIEGGKFINNIYKE